jgi:hypothetical protein
VTIITHQIKTPNSAASVLETAFGYFNEEDIVRLKDKYKRKPKLIG